MDSKNSTEILLRWKWPEPLIIYLFFSSRSGQWKELVNKKELDQYSRGSFDSKGLQIQAPQIDELQSIFLSGQSTTVSHAILNFLY